MRQLITLPMGELIPAKPALPYPDFFVLQAALAPAWSTTTERGSSRPCRRLGGLGQSCPGDEDHPVVGSASELFITFTLVNKISLNLFVRLHNLLNWIARLPQAFESWKLRTYPQTNGIKTRNRLRIPIP